MRPILIALLATGFSYTVSARSIWLTADTNSPDPNQEITVYVHTDTPLYTMELWATVISGDNVQALYNSPYQYTIWGDKILFAEDGQTFFVSQADINLAHNPGLVNYLQSDLDLPEYGMYHSWAPISDNRYFVSNHRQMDTGTVYSAFALPALIMEQRSNWNHPAFFDYVDRFTEINGWYGDSSYKGLSYPWAAHETALAQAMWNTYRKLPAYLPYWTRITDTNPDLPPNGTSPDPYSSCYSNGHSGTIFNDNFESGNFSTMKNWVHQGSGTTVSNTAGNPDYGYGASTYGARLQGSSSTNYIYKAQSTQGFHGITVIYNRRVNSSSSVTLNVAYSIDGISYTTLENVSGSSGTAWQPKTWNSSSTPPIPSSANDNPNFRIRFMTTSGSANYAYIDNVFITGIIN